MTRLRILHPLRERDFALFQTSGRLPEPMPTEPEPVEVRV
jgi:hypothetical protein